MVVSVLNSVVMPILRFCVDLFFQVFDALGAREFVFGAFCCCVVFRFLLAPILGSHTDFTRRDIVTNTGDNFNVPYIPAPPSEQIESNNDYLIESRD